MPSLVKKAIRKRLTQLEQITDRAGVRVVLRYRRDLELVRESVRVGFDVVEEVDKLTALEDDRLGYLGVHMIVRQGGVDGRRAADLDGLDCEIQLQTSAESIWAQASHELLYKVPIDQPMAVRRRINRLVALVELFDGELDETSGAIMKSTQFREGRMIATLEAEFLGLVGADYDPKLTQVIVSGLAALYSADEIDHFDRLMHDFVDLNAKKIRRLYSKYQDAGRNPILFQPESLMLFERLETKPSRLRGQWNRILPEELLDQVVSLWGVRT